VLDNSLPGDRFCGLNNEITLLRDLGCYADFTMPSGASPTQARLINTIYWAVDDPDKPKSYDTGVPVIPGATANGRFIDDSWAIRHQVGAAPDAANRAQRTLFL
jgi:hypothetical protein